jgi:hypothetical protein
MKTNFNTLTAQQQLIVTSWAERTIKNSLFCDTCLVDALLGQHHAAQRGSVACQFGCDNITNLYPVIPSVDDIRDNWSIEECHDFLLGCGWLFGAPKHAANQPDYSWEEEFIDYTASIAEELSEYTEPQEIFEWWRITDTFIASKLEEIGEPILDNDYGTWWGRTCTGQSIITDGTLQSLYLHIFGIPDVGEGEVTE